VIAGHGQDRAQATGDQRGGQSEVVTVDRRCEVKRDLRMFGQPCAHLLSTDSDVSYSGGHAEIYGSEGPCDSVGYRLNLGEILNDNVGRIDVYYR